MILCLKQNIFDSVFFKEWCWCALWNQQAGHSNHLHMGGINCFRMTDPKGDVMSW